MRYSQPSRGGQHLALTGTGIEAAYRNAGNDVLDA
jgi:hypothetical protein